MIFLTQSNVRRRSTGDPAIVALVGLVVAAALVVHLSDVARSTALESDRRNPFTSGYPDLNVKLPAIMTNDGVAVVTSELVDGRWKRRYSLGLGLTHVIGAIPAGGLPTGVERLAAADAGHSTSAPIDLTISSTVQRALVALTSSTPSAVLVVDAGSGDVVGSADTTGTPAWDPNLAAARGTADADPYIARRGPRTTSRATNPGSVIKPLLWASALDAGVVKPDTRFGRRRSVTPDGGTHIISNFGGSLCPSLHLVGALADSCNTVSVDIVERLGTSRTHAALRNWGIGTAAFEGGEPTIATGTPAAADNYPATVDDLAQVAIGQGEVTVTLAGLAEAYSGLLAGKVPMLRFTHAAAHVSRPRPVGSDAAETIRRGMRLAATEGTAANAARGRDVVVKTGTITRTGGPSDAIAVIGWPAEHTKYVVVTFVSATTRNLTGGHDAVALGLRALDAALAGER